MLIEKLKDVIEHVDNPACIITREGKVFANESMKREEGLLERVVKGESADVSVVDFGDFKVLLFPAAAFVAMGQMAAFIAHELRSPLSSLKVLLANIKFSDIDESMKRMNLLVSEMEAVVSNILLFMGSSKPNLEALNIEALVKEVVDEIRPKTEGMKIKESYNSDKIFVMGDKALLRRAIFNIIDNAVDALLAKREETKVVDISTWDEEEFVVVCIRDTGHGMSEEIKRKIFTPFFTTKSRGTGLGLCVVGKIVEAHSGRLEVNSEEGKGTEVKIVFPYA